MCVRICDMKYVHSGVDVCWYAKRCMGVLL